MAKVAFQLAFKTSELNALDLPIEIRKPDSTLIGRVLSTETIDLVAGSYYAVAGMPAGQRLIAPFEVAEPPAPQALTVTLAPDAEDESPHEWEEVRHFLGRQSTRVDPPAPALRTRGLPGLATPRPGDRMHGDDADEGLESIAPPPRRGSFLRVFMGNVVRRTQVPVAPQDVLHVAQADANRVMQCEVYGRDAPLIAQLVQPDGRVQNLTLPVSSATGLHLVASREPAGDVRLDAYLTNSIANMLLQYTGAGLSTTAALATSATAVNAEKLLMQKMADPIGAAIGGYAILRLGSIEQLHDWTSHLRASFSWLPDGSAICGEHLARLGRFEEAFDAFAEVPQRGLPLFSDGLFYTIERMKLYASARLKSRGRINQALAQAVVDELQPFATFVRRQRPICSYPGLDVASPSADPAPANVPDAGGLDLTPWFAPGFTAVP
jgi:hypothetical protein